MCKYSCVGRLVTRITDACGFQFAPNMRAFVFFGKQPIVHLQSATTVNNRPQKSSWWTYRVDIHTQDRRIKIDTAVVHIPVAKISYEESVVESKHDEAGAK